MSETTPYTIILGMRVDALPIQDAVHRIVTTTEQPGSRYIVKPYVEFFDGQLTDIVNGAWLSLPDGVALQWAAYYQQTSGSLWNLFKTLCQIIFQPEKIRSVIPEKYAGTNFTLPLLKAAAEHNRSVFLVGSPKHGTIEDTARELQRSIPGLHISGTLPGKDDTGRFSDQLETRLREKLQEKKPDIVLVGVGRPLQEFVIHRLAGQLEHGILIGEGGTFDYQLFGGKHKKAPQIIQRSGLEWLWRLFLEPRRIRRQLAIPRFIIKMYRFTQDKKHRMMKTNKHNHR